MTTMNATVWTCFRARDPRAIISFLEAIGFDRGIVVDGPDGRVEHAQLTWGPNGGVMLGSLRGDGSALDRSAGNTAAYLVVDRDDEVDAWFRRAIEAGGTPDAEPTDQDYGGRSAGVLDAEGNSWNCGSYAGEEAPAG